MPFHQKRAEITIIPFHLDIRTLILKEDNDNLTQGVPNIRYFSRYYNYSQFTQIVAIRQYIPLIPIILVHTFQKRSHLFTLPLSDLKLAS